MLKPCYYYYYINNNNFKTQLLKTRITNKLLLYKIGGDIKMVGSIVIGVRTTPDRIEAYKTLKKQGYTWNSIITEGIKALLDRSEATNQTAIIDKLQKTITKQGMENEILRNKFKMHELKDKLEKQEISPEEYESFKTMYEDKIKSIDIKIQERLEE